MPKRPLYARASMPLTAAAWMCLAMAASAGVSARSQDAPPCAACIVMVASAEQAAQISEDLNGIEVLITVGEDGNGTQAGLEAVRGRRGLPGLWLSGLTGGRVDPAVLASAHRIVVDLSEETSGSDELAFRLKTGLTELRSGNGTAALGIFARPDVLADLLRRDIAAYSDFHVRDGGAGRPSFPGSLAAAATIGSLQPSSRAGDATSIRSLVRLPEDDAAAQAVVGDVSRAAPFLVDGLIRGGTVEIRCAGRSVATFLNPETLDTLAIARDCRDTPVVVEPETPGLARVELSTGETVFRVPSPQGRFAQGVQVVGARTLSVREIIARHQAAAARQRRQVRQTISTGHMTLTFEAPGFPAPLVISAETITYAEPGLVEIEQRDVRVNGIAFQADRVPRLPLLEPERVASPPLEITLTDVYRYSLAGQEVVGGIRCYVVKFEPLDRQRSLFAGRAWIASDDFAMVKVSAVQTGLRGAIVSSEQIDEFRRESESVWLLARSEVHQIYEGAGHRTPIHRLLTIDRHEVNPAGFEARRDAAYNSSSIMLRDTAEGFRYLKRERNADAKGAAAATPVVTGAAERVRTIAVGVIIDPNISRPLPFAGLSYVDFNLFGTGTQMNGFFGGSYGQLAIAVPSLGGSRWQLAGRAFGIASSYNDRAFVEGREVYQANIAQRPAHASIWALRPLTARLTARAGYELDFTAYDRVDSTSAAFVVPASQVSHAVRVALEAQWSGWAASGWWSGARRAGWRMWGEGQGEYNPRHREYQRFGVTVSRAFVWSPRLVGRVEAAWMDGRDLDRFSRYSFGSFDNRLRGYPSALIRYDRGGVLRSALAWAAGRRLRLDGFLDTAYVRDPGFASAPRSYTGVGAAAEVPAPFGTLVAIEWGYGFQGINDDGRRGTRVVRVSGYKMF